MDFLFKGILDGLKGSLMIVVQNVFFDISITQTARDIFSLLTWIHP